MSARAIFGSVAVLAGLFGVAASVYAYLTPATGVDDTAGPLLAALGHAGIAAMSLAAILLPGWRGVAFGLFVLAALGTILAAVLLQQPPILVPAIIGAVALPLALILGDDR